MHGQFVWYELTSPDPDASKRFYPAFTNWGTQAFDKNYTMFTHAGVPVAGLFRLNEQMRSQGVPPNWMPYIESDNVDETAQQAKALGGTVMAGPDDIPGTGRFAVIQDPQGAVFGVYKSSQPSGAWDGNPVVGRFSWHELMTLDYPKALDFYQALFGWENQSTMDMGGGQMYQMFGQGAMYGGMYNRMPEMGAMHPFWLVYINVKDVGKAVAAATKAGATVLRPRMDIPGGTIAILSDPQGAGFALHDVAMPAAAPAEKAAATPAPRKAAKKTTKKAAKKATKKTPKKATKKAAKKATKKTAKKSAKKAVKAAAKPKRMARKPARKAPARRKAAPKRKATRVARKARRPAKQAVRRASRPKKKK